MRIHRRGPYPFESDVLDAEPPLDADARVAFDVYCVAATCRIMDGSIPETALDAICDRRELGAVFARHIKRVVRYVEVVEGDREASARRLQSTPED